MIRLWPGMYIGSSDQYGVTHMLKELVANSLDQYLAGKATRIDIHHEGPCICISDDGDGLPFDLQGTSGTSCAETFFTEIHDSPTADGHSPHIHLNSAGVGLVVITALSSLVEVVSYRAGRRWSQSFSKGKALGPAQSTPSDGRGTCITFVVDAAVMSSQSPEWSLIRRTLFDTAHLFPGVILGLQGEVFHAPGGLLDYVKFESARQDFIPQDPQPSFCLNIESDEVHINATAYGRAKTCLWRSWCNGILTTQHGTHVAGFKDALKSTCWTPASAMIHVVLKNPAFNAPTKASLATEHVRKIVRSAVRARLKQDAAANTQSPIPHA